VGMLFGAGIFAEAISLHQRTTFLKWGI